ncbi:hypothetical protein Tco_1549668 [Tanacetum coccineum]
MAHFIGCRVGEFPFTYLGIPKRVSMRRISAWNGAIDSIKSRLSEWKARAMLFGGRLTLVKSVLGSLLLYYFSMFRITVISSYGDGGLNIGSLKVKNLELLGKWWWRCTTEGENMWCRVIRSIYGIDGGWGSGGSRVRDGGVWVDILNVGKMLDGIDGGIGSFSQDMVDKWEWKLDLNGVFSVRLLASLLGRLPVHIELDKKGIDLDSLLCPGCEHVVESVDHCLVLCDKAMNV